MGKEKLLINNPKSNNSEDMSNKQIEEMVDDLMACHTEFYNNAEIYTDYYDMAQNLIAKGYRKQSEGEWVENDDMYTADMLNYRCSICGNYEYTQRNFCSKCGAKMKGGE